MIMLQELDNFFSWYAAQDAYIKHTVNGRNAYARTLSEAEQGNRNTLDFPRMEMLDLPLSYFNENNAEFEWENMSVTLRVINKCERNDWQTERETMDSCKATLARLLKYIANVVSSGNCCETDLLCFFNLNGNSIEYIDKATSGGDFVGARLRLLLKKDFDVDALVSGNYPPLYALAKNSIQVWDVNHEKFIWVPLSEISTAAGYIKKIEEDAAPKLAANLDANNKKLTNVTDGTNATDAVNLQQLNAAAQRAKNTASKLYMFYNFT